MLFSMDFGLTFSVKNSVHRVLYALLILTRIEMNNIALYLKCKKYQFVNCVTNAHDNVNIGSWFLSFKYLT